MRALARVLNKSGTEDIEIDESRLVSIVICLGDKRFSITDGGGKLGISTPNSNLVVEPITMNIILVSEAE